MTTGKATPAAPRSESPRPRATGDARLLPNLLRVTIAYVDALEAAGLISDAERKIIAEAIQKLEKEVEAGTYATHPTAIAALNERFRELAKDTAHKASLGRSRVEQMATALRLWLIEETETLTNKIADVQRALLTLAENHVATLMPGYIGVRPVQVISCSHWLLGYFWMLARDQERFSAAIGRASVLPLGSGLLAGTPYRIDRRNLAQELGLAAEGENSIDSIHDLDFAAEFLFAAALLSAHLSRLVDELLIFSNPALGFVTLDSKYTGISGVNPEPQTDAIEQVNARSGMLLGTLTGFLTSTRTMPAPFNAESPASRAALFESSDQITALLTTVEGAINTLTVHPDHMYNALEERILATDVVDYLVTRGEDPEKAQRAVEALFAKAARVNKPVADMELKELQKENAAFDADVFALFDYSRSAAQRATIGGTAPAAIRTQIRRALNWLVEAGLE